MFNILKYKLNIYDRGFENIPVFCQCFSQINYSMLLNSVIQFYSQVISLVLYSVTSKSQISQNFPIFFLRWSSFMIKPISVIIISHFMRRLVFIMDLLGHLCKGSSFAHFLLLAKRVGICDFLELSFGSQHIEIR